MERARKRKGGDGSKMVGEIFSLPAANLRENNLKVPSQPTRWSFYRFTWGTVKTTPDLNKISHFTSTSQFNRFVYPSVNYLDFFVGWMCLFACFF
jgi:hypothetical protein